MWQFWSFSLIFIVCVIKINMIAYVFDKLISTKGEYRCLRPFPYLLIKSHAHVLQYFLKDDSIPPGTLKPLHPFILGDYMTIHLGENLLTASIVCEASDAIVSNADKPTLLWAVKTCSIQQPLWRICALYYLRLAVNWNKKLCNRYHWISHTKWWVYDIYICIQDEINLSWPSLLGYHCFGIKYNGFPFTSLLVYSNSKCQRWNNSNNYSLFFKHLLGLLKPIIFKRCT